MNKISFTKTGFQDYLYWQTKDKKTLKKINALIKSIQREGTMEGLGKPEPLKGNNSEFSRRIDKANRLVYIITDNSIEIRSCRGHYQDK